MKQSSLGSWEAVARAAFSTFCCDVHRCIQLVECFKLTKTMSAMLFAILAVIPDVVRFMSILFLWSVGFAFVIFWLMVGEGLHHGLSMEQAMHIDMGDGHEGPHAVIYFELLSYIKLTIIQVNPHSTYSTALQATATQPCPAQCCHNALTEFLLVHGCRQSLTPDGLSGSCLASACGPAL